MHRRRRGRRVRALAPLARMTSGTWDRHSGRTDTYDVVGLGFNYRLDEPRSALLLSRMGRLEEEIERRRELTLRYRSLLSQVEGIIVPFTDEEVPSSSSYVIPIMLEEDGRQGEVSSRLRERGIQTSIFYPSIHRFTRLPRALPRRLAADHRARLAHRADAALLPAHDPRRPGPRRHGARRGGRAPMSDWRVPLTDIAVARAGRAGGARLPRVRLADDGAAHAAFEQALAELRRHPHAVTVSSGTAALHLACLAAGIGPGDEVIVPAFTFVASAAAVRYVGAEPVLCDVRRAARLQPRPGGRRAPHHAAHARHDRRPLLRLPGRRRRAAGALRRARARADRGLRAGDRRTRRRHRAPGRDGRASSARSASSPRSSSASARAAW